MHPPLHRPRHLPQSLLMGLHLQHGGQRRGRDYPERHVDVLLNTKVQGESADVGGVAGNCGLVGAGGDEFGTAGFSAGWGVFGCACVVAFGDGVSHGVVL